MKKVSQREVLEILNKLDQIERENPEIYQKIIRGDVKIDSTVEEKTKCKCDL